MCCVYTLKHTQLHLYKQWFSSLTKMQVWGLWLIPSDWRFSEPCSQASSLWSSLMCTSRKTVRWTVRFEKQGHGTTEILTAELKLVSCPDHIRLECVVYTHSNILNFIHHYSVHTMILKWHGLMIMQHANPRPLVWLPVTDSFLTLAPKPSSPLFMIKSHGQPTHTSQQKTDWWTKSNFLGLFLRSDKDQWDCKIANYYFTCNSKLHLYSGIPTLFEWIWCKNVLSYTVTLAQENWLCLLDHFSSWEVWGRDCL